MAESTGLVIAVDLSGLDLLSGRASVGLDQIGSIKKAVSEYGRIMQRRAVANVSGISRSFKGASRFSASTWVINRQTGKLARSIQVTQPNPLAAIVEASADYASAVHDGSPQVDLKKTKLAGKIVPFPINAKVAKAAQNMLVSGGLKEYKRLDSRGNVIRTVHGIRTQAQYASTGKNMGQRGVVFRRVPGPSGKGWVIKPRPGRPFLEEAGHYVEPMLKDAVEKAYVQFLEANA